MIIMIKMFGIYRYKKEISHLGIETAMPRLWIALFPKIRRA